MNEPMISLMPTTAAPAAGRASAKSGPSNGDAFAAKLHKAVNARQPAVKTNAERTPPDATIVHEASDQPSTDDSTNEPVTDTETPATGDRLPAVHTTPHDGHEGTASTVDAAAVSVVAPLLAAVTAPVAASPSTAPAAATPQTPLAVAAAAASQQPAESPPIAPAPAASPPSATPPAVPATAGPSASAIPTALVTEPVANGDAVANRSADAPAQPAVVSGLAADNAIVAKGAVDADTDDSDDPKQRRGGSARGAADATGGRLVGPADVVVTANSTSRAGERASSAPASTEAVVTAPHADHQAVARAADVLTTGEHTGPTTTNRLSLEMDGSSRVAVRMDDTGHFVRVDVLADPNGRLDGAWHADMSDGLRNHGLELDQRGADNKGEGHHREDNPDDRFATDGGLPWKPVRSPPGSPGFPMAVTNGEAMSAIAGMGAATTTSTTASAMGSLGPDAFMKLLVAQMKYQNPFAPSDPTAMLGQVATYSQVEMLQKMSATASSSAALQQANMAADVIGKFVTATGTDGKDVTGTVTSTRFTADGPVLVLDGSNEIPLAALTGVGAAPTAPPATSAVPAPTATTTAASVDTDTTTTPTSTPA